MKKMLLLSSIFLIVLLSSCTNNEYMSAGMDMRIREAYYNEFILPENPKAKLEDVEYYKFLRRFPDGGVYSYLIVWEVYIDSDEWTLTIENCDFYFIHEAKILIYRGKTKEFLSIVEAYNEKIVTFEELDNAFQKTDELYIEYKRRTI